MSKNRLHMGRKYISCLLCSVHPVTASVAGALKGNYGRRETEVELLVLLFPKQQSEKNTPYFQTPEILPLQYGHKT